MSVARMLLDQTVSRIFELDKRNLGEEAKVGSATQNL
jgi:hypothetical protein